MIPLRRTSWLALSCALLLAAGPGAHGMAQEAVLEAGAVREVAIPGSELTFEMVFLPGGTFTMGSPPDEPGHEGHEAPAHDVRVSPFWMGAREVTHDEYELFRFRRLDGPQAATGDFDVDGVTRPSPPYEDPAHGMGKSGHPAVGMTRQGALRYAEWLSAKTGRLFRLPTEAEWEHACRMADPASPSQSAPQDAYAPVGAGEPSRLGLHDLLGNVAEWVMDAYSSSAYTRASDGPVVDPQMGEPTRGRGLVRGASFADDAGERRCAARFPEDSRWKRRDPQIPRSRWWNTDSPHVGFRLVSPARELSPEEIRAFWAGVFGSG